MRRKRLMALALILFLGCARTSTAPRETGAFTDSAVSHGEEREAEVGRRIHEAIVSSFRVYTEPQLVEYVTRIGQSVARAAERQDLDYRFTVLYDQRIYAADAPGGFVYITTGFLNFLQNEAELAAVLAHEIAELQYRDGRFSTSRRALQLAAETGAVVGPFFGPIGTLTTAGVVLLHAFAESREASRDERITLADQRALRYLVEAGHDPQGCLDLLSRFLNIGSAWAPYSYDYVSSRPVTLKRYEAALAAFEKLPLQGKSFAANRDTFLEMTKGVREIYKA